MKGLRNSHLLPAAVWRRTRESANPVDPNPIVVAGGNAFSTSRQVQAHLLCDECEQRLSRKGESLVLSQCAAPGGAFPLRESLERTKPTFEDNELRVYDASGVLGTSVGDYLYFAASVFWRAAVHSWSFGKHRIEKLELGSRYIEEFRLYLCDQASFPAQARLFLHLSSEPKPEMSAVFPCSARPEGARRHKFYIPGMLFMLFLGKDAPTKHGKLALNSQGGGFVWLCPWMNDELFLASMRLAERATKTSALGTQGGSSAG